MRKSILLLLLFTFVLAAPVCNQRSGELQQKTELIINTSHLDSLYEEVTSFGNTFGIIHIYSEYPDYKWVGDSDEGIACIDDAARAAIFYMEKYKSHGDESSLYKAKKLLEFIFYMHSENGFFYNFIFDDYSINKQHANSINEPNWWSWRAMWALSEGYRLYKNVDHQFAELIFSCFSKAVDATKKLIPNENKSKTVDGISFPTWLPGESASDQASVLIPALLNYLEEKKDTLLLKYLNQLCDGILQMQKGDSVNIPYYAFLSWQNIWHAYGNSQSYSLLKASSFLDRADLFNAALNEVDYFYDYLIKEKHMSTFTLGIDEDHFKFGTNQKFSQIAYNFRPMIYSCLEAFRMTNDSVYAIKAGELASWFFGYNIVNQQMYFSSTGICYDGINSETSVNKNSGAESTIEALLALHAIENNPIAQNTLTRIISKKVIK
jgi:hypothetical protein